MTVMRVHIEIGCSDEDDMRLSIFRVPVLLHERGVEVLPLPLLRRHLLVAATHEDLALLRVAVQTLVGDGVVQLRRLLLEKGPSHISTKL